MTINKPTDESRLDERLADWGAVARYAVTKIIDLLFSEHAPKTLLWTIAIIEAGHLGYVWSLPEEARVSLNSPLPEIANTVNAILGGKLFAWGGWGLFVVSLVFFATVTKVLWQRVQTQGKLLKERRDELDVNRVSSRNERSIEEYDRKMERKFGDSHDDLHN